MSPKEKPGIYESQDNTSLCKLALVGSTTTQTAPLWLIIEMRLTNKIFDKMHQALGSGRLRLNWANPGTHSHNILFDTKFFDLWSFFKAVSTKSQPSTKGIFCCFVFRFSDNASKLWKNFSNKISYISWLIDETIPFFITSLDR